VADKIHDDGFRREAERLVAEDGAGTRSRVVDSAVTRALINELETVEVESALKSAAIAAMQQDVADAQQFADTLFESMPAAAIQCSTDSTIVRINKAAETLLGMRINAGATLLGMRINAAANVDLHSLAHPLDEMLWDAFFESILAGDDPGAKSLRLIDDNDSTVTVNVRGMKTASGVCLLLVVESSSTESPEPKHILRVEQGAAGAAGDVPIGFDAVFDSLSIPCLLCSDRRVVFANTASRRLTGSMRDQISGQSLETLLDMQLDVPGALSFKTDNVQSKTGRHSEPVYATITPPGGTSSRCKIWSSPIELDGEWFDLVVLVDVGSVVETRELLRSARIDARQDMIGDLNHALNNLLSGIALPAQMLERDLQSNKDRRRAGAICETARRATEFVQQLTHIVRKFDENTEPVDVNVAVREAVAITRSTWQTRRPGVEVVLELDATVAAQGRVTHLPDLIAAMIDNSVEALADGGTIVVRTASTNSTVDISVRDDGVGMDKETSDRLFTPLFSTKAEPRRGLSLYECHCGVCAWGGEVDVQSVEGCGTTVTLHLNAAPDNKPHDAGGNGSIQGNRILVVDPDERSLGMFADTLGSDYRLRLIRGGKVALDLLKPEYCDIAFVSALLSDRSYADVAERVHALGGTVIVVADSDNPVCDIAGRECRICASPVTAEGILSTIRIVTSNGGS
jgi:signal transduction histidine kinase